MVAVPERELCGELHPSDLSGGFPHIGRERRRVELAGCVNFRDVGGYRTADGRSVRTGRLYRSDGLQGLAADDVATIRDRLGVRTVFDLRTPAEIVEFDTGPLFDCGTVRRVHTPLFTDIPAHWDRPREEWTLEGGVQIYVEFLELGREQIAGIARALGEPSTYPAVIHCVAGKDRTGVLCALLLETLGVAEGDVVADYMLTREVIDDETMAPEKMRRVLERVRATYGSAAGYFHESGLTASELQQLREQLLD
jgi:protein-tyrosine phosphatase